VIWWIWVVVGLVLFTVEIMTPGGFFIFFFAVGGVFVGIIMSIVPNISFANQLYLFCFLSVAFLLLFRKPLQRWFQDRSPSDFEEFAGSEVTVIEEIAPAEMGLVEFRGSPWKATHKGTESLPVGSKCKIVEIDKLTIIVEYTNK